MTEGVTTMIKRHRPLAVAMVLALGAGLAAPAAMAAGPQTQAEGQAPTPPKAQPRKLDTGPPPTNAELHHFVDAAFAVQKIGKQVRPEIKQAKDSQARLKLQQQAEQKMKAAVKKNGLTVKRYQQIYMAMQENKHVKHEVQKLVRARNGAKQQ